MQQQEVAIAVSILALLVSLGNYLTNRSNSAQARAALQQTMRENWRALSRDWGITLMCARGVNDYYATADVDLRNEMLGDIQSYREVYEGFTGSISDTLVDSPYIVTTGLRRKYIDASDRVLDFLTLSADLVLRGDLAVADLYSFLGPQVARHHLALRIMAGAAPQKSGNKTVPAFSPERFDGRLDRILTLTDLLWAELARRKDLAAHQVAAAAAHKQRTGSGIQCRRRVRRLARSRTSSATWLLRLRLQRHLMNAEFLSPSYLATNYGNLMYDSYRALKEGNWRVRYFKGFLKSALPECLVDQMTRIVRNLRRATGRKHVSPDQTAEARHRRA